MLTPAVEPRGPARAAGAQERYATRTVGWRRALRLRDEIAGRLREGRGAGLDLDRA